MGSKYAPYEVKMSSLTACEGALRRKTWLDVVKVIPRPSATVPTKHFGVVLETIWEDF